MRKTDTILIACWEDEIDFVSEMIESNGYSAKSIDIVVFSEEGESLSNVSLSTEAKLVTLPPSQFTQREPLLKAPSDLALWLFGCAERYQNILCSLQGGLVFFVSRLNSTLQSCCHWEIDTFSEATTRNCYQRTRRFLDKQGVLRDFIERYPTYLDCRESSIDSGEIDDASLVTVIIPFHNRVDFIDQTLLSLLQQTVQGMQILIINDDSDPDKRQTLANILSAQAFKRLDIQLIDSGAPLGAAGARNLGLSKVTTPFVLFIDDDDVFVPSTIELCLEAQQRTNSDIVTMSFSYFEGTKYPDFSETPGMLIHFHSDQDWVSALSYNCIGGISALYRTTVIQRYGGFKCGPFAGEEDWQLLLKLSVEGCKFVNLPLPLLWYRNTPFSLSKKMLHFDSRHQLFKLYERVLPRQLLALPEYLTSHYQALKSSDKEIPFARLGFQLAQCAERPLYIYGAGQIGSQVMEILGALEMKELVVNVIDRNASFIRFLDEHPVVTLDDCNFVDEAVVIIASLSFVDDIINLLPSSDLHVIRLDTL